MSRKTSIIILIILIGFSLIISGCSERSNRKELSKLEQIKEKGKIVLGTAADYPPYEFHKQIDGEDQIVGFDIKIAREIAKSLGVKLEIKDMKFNGLLAALKANKIDFIIAGMVPTKERRKSVDFSKKYYQAEQRLLTKKESNYKTIDDLAGLRVGAQKASVQEEIAKKKIDSSEVKSLGKITDLVLELKNNKIDGIVLVEPVAKPYAEANKDLKVAEVSLGIEDGVAIAVQQDTPQLLHEINNTLDKLKEKKKIDEFIKEATKLSSKK